MADPTTRSREVAHGLLDSRRGWSIVAAVFVLLTVNSGLGFYNLSVYLRVLNTQRGFPLSSASGATAAFFVASGVSGLLVARQIRLRDPRYSLAAGAVLGAAALLLISSARQAWQLYLAYVVFGIAFTSAGLVPGTTVVTQWFRQRRSLALSVASTGLSIGGIALTPLSVFLMERYGIGRAGPVLAAMWFLGIFPLALLVVRPGPLSAAAGLSRGDAAPLALRSLLRHPFFVRMNVAYVLLLLAQVGVLAHLYNLGSERVGEPVAALMVSVLAFASVVGRLAGGWALTVVPSVRFAGVLVVVQAVAVAVLARAGSPSALLAGAALLGVAVGNLLMLQSLLISEAFGERPYAGLFATSQLLTTAGYAAGAWLLGQLHERLGGYETPLLAFSAVSVLAAWVLASTPVVRRVED